MIFPAPDPVRAARYRAAGHWRHETIPALIEASAQRTPEKIAIRDASGKALTYAALIEAASRFSGFLAAKGIGRGDIVTACLPNWCETVIGFLGIMRIGAVVNPVPVTYGRADIAYVTKKCASKALLLPVSFRSTDYNALIDDLAPELPAGIALLQVGEGATRPTLAEALRAEPAALAATMRADDPVAVLFTSGTESRPKGAVHTHNTILFGERALATALGVDDRDIAFMASPISHTTGFMHGVIMTLTLGGTLSLLDQFEGKRAANQMRDHACTWTMGATPFLADVATALAAENTRLSALRYYLCGGAPIPEALVKRAAEVEIRTLAIYGSTESPPHTMVHPEDPEENTWTTDGRPLAGIEVRIVGDGGIDLPAGEIGEEYSRGPNTFLGYLGEPDLTAKDFDAEGWYHSSDLARMLPDGSVRISGRLKDIIVRGGQNISVREIEDYLIAHPSVQMVVVVGVPHARLGETGCAVIVPKPGTAPTLAEITDYLLALGVARFKLPERLELWSELPQTPSGKIQKFLIRQKLNNSDHKSSEPTP
ncbi:MAG: cyclohexanecarboxylate-CoA ligase [Rhizobiales bacterium PAR1]|nr:MAG: cyclohexanecarboxylate-CoA ligase [Rhizobiales bacterium PAR1]